MPITTARLAMRADPNTVLGAEAANSPLLGFLRTAGPRENGTNVVSQSIEGVTDWFLKSLQENTLATIIGTLFVAKITRVLDLAVDLVKGASALGRGAKNFAEVIFPGAKPVGTPPTVPAGTTGGEWRMGEFLS